MLSFLCSMIEVAVVKPMCTSLNAAEHCLVSKDQGWLQQLSTIHLHSFCILSTLASLRPFMLFKSLLLLCARASTECTPLSFSFLMSAAAMPNSCVLTESQTVTYGNLTHYTRVGVGPAASLWALRSLEVPPLLLPSVAPRTLPCLSTLPDSMQEPLIPILSPEQTEISLQSELHDQHQACYELTFRMFKNLLMSSNSSSTLLEYTQKPKPFYAT